MADALRVLLIEDTEDDAELILRELHRSGFNPVHERVQTVAALRAALEGPWDLILCDYTMPELDAPTALAIIREARIDAPVIVVSGTVGEETAVQVMRFGAADYLLKDNLRRLGPAVTREIREASVRADRRRADDARREAEASFRRIIEGTPDLVIVHSGDVVVYANPTALSTLGYEDPSELVGKPLAAIVVTTDGTRAERLWRKRDGSTIAVELFDESIMFEGVPATVKLARDTTERNKVTTAMMEVDRMAAIGVLAAGVAHEINNPLAYVLANLEYVSTEIESLLGEIPKAAAAKLTTRLTDVRQALADMGHGARRVRDIVQDIRTFSRGGEEKVGMIDVRSVLDSSIRMATVQIRQRATIVRNYDDVPLVLANESRLGQVFLNLVTNAAQAVPEGKIEANTITIGVRFEQGLVVVTVADTGVGISRDALARLFEPFFTTKPVGHGTGLGLAISRRIVTALGGTIDVASEPGKGTTLTVRLPPADPGTTQPRAPTMRPDAPSRRGSLLVIDDEPALGVALRRLLLAEHDVTVVTSAVAARERILAGERFDVVLCDLMMPGMTGMELYAELEKHAPALAARMVFLTGAVSSPKARVFLDTVSNSRLEKPIGIEDLRTTIGAMLERP